MKLLLTLIITVVSCACSCQTNNFGFVNELSIKYDKEIYNYQQQAKQIVIDFINSNKNVNLNIDSINFIFIPEILLKQDKNLYKTIDTANIVKYFDVSSMYYNRVFVVKNNIFIGQIIDGYAKFGIHEFFPKPSVENFIYESYSDIICIFQPEIVFSVQNIGLFCVKNNQLFSFCYNENTKENEICNINEFVLRDYDLFNPLTFRYFPRKKPVVVY